MSMTGSTLHIYRGVLVTDLLDARSPRLDLDNSSSLQLLKTMKQALLKDTADEVKQCEPKRVVQSTKAAKKGPQKGDASAAEPKNYMEGSGNS